MGWNYLSIPKLQRCNRWSLGMDKLFHPILYNGYYYLSMPGLKLNHVSKRGHGTYYVMVFEDIAHCPRDRLSITAWYAIFVALATFRIYHIGSHNQNGPRRWLGSSKWQDTDCAEEGKNIYSLTIEETQSIEWVEIYIYIKYIYIIRIRFSLRQ